jgi:hypothetical protein
MTFLNLFKHQETGRTRSAAPNASNTPKERHPIPQLTEFQVRSLEDVARATIPTYLLIVPNTLLDTQDRFDLYRQSNAETDDLIELGLLTDVSANHADAIKSHLNKGGREFRVLQITPTGKAMFNATSSGSSVN